MALLPACTVQKSHKELSFLEKEFLNTNARYNGYYNAKELMKSSMANLEAQHRDNYNQVLEMYKYIAADNPQAVAPDLDLAMKKVSIVVNLYRRSKWTDDCYLLVGQAQFLKKDYESAESTLRYLLGEFDPNAPVKKKPGVSSATKKTPAQIKATRKQKQKLAKQKAKARQKYNRQLQKNKKKAAKAKAKAKTPPPKPSQTQDPKEAEKQAQKAAEEAARKAKEQAKQDQKKEKNRTATQDAELWLAKTLIERDNHEAAVRILSRLIENPKTWDDVRREALKTQAYGFARAKAYERALPLLEQTIALSEDKKDKARLSYIAGQLHQRAGRYAQAITAYEQALKLTNDYEMAFNARLNIALSSANSSGSAAAARESLEKMLKDIKNEEYKDQIYYALAEIAFRDGNKPAGVQNLELALLYSKGNQPQKAEAYYKLAEIYFEDENFVKAKKYYDSTLMTMSNTDPRFKDTKHLAENLTDIAKYLSVIAEQDSLLAIAELSPKARAELAAKVKAERDEQRRNAALAAANSSAASGADRFKGGNLPVVEQRLPGDTRSQSGSNSSFFAYNERELRQGLRDFQRKWGNRPLEDNWRRSDRGITSGVAAVAENSTVPTNGEETTSGALSEAEIKEILGNYPTNEEELTQAHIKIKEAMFNLGKLYRDKLQRLDKAADVLENLNRRFPANNYELDSWYLLYLLFTDMNQPAKAREYADKIIQKYPTSVYGKVLQDPAYVKELANERQRLNAYYDQTYAAFQRGEYQRAYEQAQAAREKFGSNNPLAAKFALLSAMCMGNLQSKNAYVAGLNEVIAKYPNTPEQTRAREMLRLIGGTTAALPGGNQSTLVDDGPLYTLEDEDLHYVLIYLERDAKIEEARIRVSDFNQKYHDLDKLRIANVFIGPANDIPVLVLRRFKDKKEAMRYISGTEKNSKDFLNPANGAYTVLAISQNNYRNLLRDKRPDVYLEFYNRNYRGG